MESKPQGSSWAFQGPLVCTNLEPKMQTLTRVDKGAIKDYNHMTIMDGTNIIYVVSFSSKP